MKKFIAIIMMLSFITVNTAGAFAAERPNSRNRVSGRVEQRSNSRDRASGRTEQRSNLRNRLSGRTEQRNTNRGSDTRRQLQRNDRPSTNRSGTLSRRSNFDRLSRPATRDFFRNSRPMGSYGSSFFNRSRGYYRRPFPSYSSRPYSIPYSRPYYGHRRSSSISPLEFLGIGAAIIAIAAAASHANCDY